jgi:hypothetical protein
MSGNFSDWSPLQNFVQSGLVDGEYVNAGYMLLAAGPPRIANIGGAASFAQALSGNGQAANQVVLPIGVLQSFNLGHNRQFSRIFEIGSERSYFISGRTVGQLGLGRVYYHGASLLRILYAYYQDDIGPTVVPSMWPNAGASAQSNPHDVIIPPGYENLFFNLASDLFAQPMGILMYVRDINQDALGALYFEACYLPNHSIATDSQGVLLQENVAVQFERAVPVAISQLSLISTNNSNAGGANLSSTYLGIPDSVTSSGGGATTTAGTP